MVLLSLTLEQTAPRGLFIIMYVKPMRGNNILQFTIKSFFGKVKCMKKICFLFLAVALLCAVGCKKETKPEPEEAPVILWNHYTYSDYNAHIYLKLENNKAEAICCGSANMIVGRIKLTHDCTEAQFETIQKKLVDNGAVQEEPVAEPVIDGYPDMTAYLGMFLSKEKQEEIWKELAGE